MNCAYAVLDSPIGELTVVTAGAAVREIRFPKERSTFEPGAGWSEGGRAIERVARQLAQYFANRRREFDLELEPMGTPFQRQVWRELVRIPYGQTISYGTLARRIGKPTASRAVGAANGRNPIPIVIPCHRVVGSDGKLTGFGGGLDLKRFLLEHEADLLVR